MQREQIPGGKTIINSQFKLNEEIKTNSVIYRGLITWNRIRGYSHGGSGTRSCLEFAAVSDHQYITAKSRSYI
jgi:hypothetical protein